MHASRPNFLVVLLAATTLAGGALAWREYRELDAARAAANPAGDAALRRQLAAAEARVRELEDRLAARPAGDAAAENAPRASTAVAPGAAQGRGFGGRGGADFRAVLDSPLGQRVQQAQQKLALDSRYAALFKNLNLPADKLDQFKTLLLEKQTSVQDVFAAAEQQGLDPRTSRDQMRQLIANAQNEIDGSIKSLLGADGYAQYEQFQQTQPQRTLVNQLQQSLSYTAAPLSAAQADQLVQILAANAPAGRGGNGGDVFFAGGTPPTPPDGGGRGGVFFAGGPGGFGGATITNEAVSAAQQVLSAPQLDALQQLQQTQQAQQQLNQLMRTNRDGGAPAPRGGG